MKKYPSGSVELYEMIDEAKVFLNECLRRDKAYANAENMSYEELICRLYIECCNYIDKVDNMQRKLNYAQQNVEKAESAVKTIDEAFKIAKVKIMENYFNEVGKTEEYGKIGLNEAKYSTDYIAGYATAIGDLNKFLKSGE